MPTPPASAPTKRTISVVLPAIVFLLAAGMVVLFISGFANEALHPLAMAVSIAFGFACVCLIVVPLMIRRGLARMADEHDIVHWIYSPQQWAAHLEAERQRVPYFGLLVGVLCVLINMAVWIIGALLNWKEGWDLFITFLGYTIGAFILGYGFGYLFEAHERYVIRLQQRADPQVFIGPSGIFIAGVRRAWIDGDTRLSNIYFEKVPSPMLKLIFRHTGRFPYSDEVRVPVPMGMEADGPRVAAELKRLCELT